MKIKYAAALFEEINANALVLLTFQSEKPTGKLLKSLDSATDGAVTSLYETEEFTAKNGETAILHNPAGFKAGKIILLGLRQQVERSLLALSRQTLRMPIRIWHIFSRPSP